MWGKGVGRRYQNEEILKFVPSRLLKSLTNDKNQGHQLIFTDNVQIEAKKYFKICLVFWKSEPQKKTCIHDCKYYKFCNFE